MLANEGVEIQMAPRNKKEAIKESITKWDHLCDMLRDVEDAIYDDSCPLCSLCLDDGECIDCPISNHTGENRCADTPWIDVRDALANAISAVDEMLEFLAYIEQKED